MLKYLLILSFTHLLILSSCSEQKHCARFIRKHPACFRVDTVYKMDTTHTPASRLDTAFVDRINTVHDTVTVENDSMIIKYIRVRDTVYLKGKVKAQTLIKKIPVKVMGPTIVKREMYIPWWIWLIIAGLSCLSIWLILLILRAQFFKHVDGFR